MISAYAYPGLNQTFTNHINNQEQVYTVKQIVCKYYGVTIESLSMRTRKREVVISRQVSMVIIKNKSSFSLKKIGSYFGGRDHSTVIHAIQTIDDLTSTDKKIKADFDFLSNVVTEYLRTGIINQK
jgi:chromosomal replication initiator protein